jgi:amino acid transporter
MTFMGFESTATVAEETQNPRKNIPRAIWGSVIGMGVFYVIVTYAMSVGFGVKHGDAFASNTVPLDYLSTRFGNSTLTTLIDIAGIISAFAVSLASNNAAVRLLYAMGREGVISKSLGKTHKTLLTPANAIHSVGVFAMILGLASGIAFGPYPNGYGMIGAFGSLPILVCYVLASISLIRFVKKKDAKSFNIWVHGIAPAIGGLIMLLPLYGSIFPLPKWPYNLILGLVFLYILAGIVVGFVLKRRSSHLLDQLGDLMNGDDSKHTA